MTTDTIILAADPVALDKYESKVLDQQIPGSDAKWYRLNPDGEVKTRNGPFVFDAESWASINAHRIDHGNDLYVDWEHQSLQGEYAAPNGQAPAAGWIKILKYIPGEGFFAAIQWTALAKEQIEKKHYRYLSPVFLVEKVGRRALVFDSVALTNRPAIAHAVPLAAKHLPRKEDSMDGIDKLREALKARGAAVEGQGEEQLIALAVTKLAEKPKADALLTEQWHTAEAIATSTRKALGLKEDASAEAVTVALTAKLSGTDTAVAKAAREGLGLSAEATADAVTLALKKNADAGETLALKAKVEALEKDLDARRMSEFFAPYTAKGVVDPQARKDEYETYVRVFKASPEDAKRLLDRELAALPHQTRLTPVSGGAGKDRAGVIAACKAELAAEGRTAFSARSFVNARLREAGHALLGKDEEPALVAG